MRHPLLKLNLAFNLGLLLTLALLGLMTYLSPGVSSAQAADRTVCLAGPPTCTYTNVQAAVDAATPGDVIKVAAGTYTGVSARAGVTQVVYINKSITLRGGYTSAFTEPPDPQANPTTLDAQGQGRVLYITGNSSNIEGLRLTGGNSNNLLSSLGGGVYVLTATATLSNNQVFSNVAYVGGGIFLSRSKATLSGNRVTTNTATYGGGLVLEESPATLNDNEIKANTAASEGGGLYLGDSDAKLDHNRIVANTAITYGGGLYLRESNPVLSRNVISGNSSTTSGLGFGGGVYAITSTSILSQNLFFNNKAPIGGGLHLLFSPVTLYGNRILSNTADYGGGLILERSNGQLTNNIIANNRINIEGGGMYIASASPHLRHTTIARNQGGDGSGIFVWGMTGNPSWPIFTNTIIVSQTVGITATSGGAVTLMGILLSGNLMDVGGSGSFPGTGIYTGAPAFVDPDGDDYHLGPTSAAIDKGINAGVFDDIDGEIRPQGTAPDLGADEFSIPLPSLALSKSGPLTATTGSPITYTLTVTNSGSLTAANLVITDAIPVGANYVSGGSRVGNVVSWTMPSLAANGGVTQTSFVVTATQAITNRDYRVRAEGGYSATGSLTVTTLITDVPIEGLAALNDSPTLLGQTTMLTASVTAGSHVTYTWAFGDGAMGSGAVVTHTYPAVGIYTAVVTVSNPVGLVTATTTVSITGLPQLSLSKSGPLMATTGSPITYTLTVTNSGSLTAASLVITDAIPVGANYVSGGSRMGNVVSWTISSLAANGGVTQTSFVVTATQAITNRDYRVRAEGGYSATGSAVIVTIFNQIISEQKVFLPLILKY